MSIYRYRRPSEYLENEIVKGEIFFASILDMNDFYDGYFRYSSEGDLEKHMELITSQVKELAKEILARFDDKTEVQKRLENYTEIDSVTWANSILNSPDYVRQSVEQLRKDFRYHPEKIEQTVKVQNENAGTMRRLISICCFSKKRLDMSMFGYYAEDGKGVMIEYLDTKGITRDVNYVDSLPKITIDKTISETMEMQVFNKLNCWSHEQEIRAYVYAENQVRTDHGLKIKEIFIGPRTGSEFATKIVLWAQKIGVPVIFPKTDKAGLKNWK